MVSSAPIAPIGCADLAGFPRFAPDAVVWRHYTDHGGVFVEPDPTLGERHETDQRSGLWSQAVPD